MSTAEPEHKLTKSSVNYSEGHKNSRCGVCKWFKPQGKRDDGMCAWVHGWIDPDYWCELFKKRAA